EGQIRKFLEKHLPAAIAPEAEAEEDEAGALLAEGDREGALEKLGEAIAIDPANDAARFEYVRLLVESGKLTDARTALEPVKGKLSGHVTDQRFVAVDLYLRAHVAAANLPAEAELQAAVSANARDFASWLGIAQRLWIRGEAAAAMDALLEIIRRDRNWDDGIARRTYVAILELLGARSKAPTQPAAAAPAGKLITSAARTQTAPQDPLIADYRRKLSMALF
ncbi:MAG: tetratricopeptide repeat protein, partial [Betaproteobacteria bacterium]